MTNEWQPVGPVPVAMETRTIGERLILIVPEPDGLRVTDAICPHKFAMLEEGTFGDGCVTCPQHEATFSLIDGSAGDDASWAGRLPVHEAKVDGDQLLVRLTN